MQALHENLCMTMYAASAFLRFQRDVDGVDTTENTSAWFSIAAIFVLTRFPTRIKKVALRTHGARAHTEQMLQHQMREDAKTVNCCEWIARQHFTTIGPRHG